MRSEANPQAVAALTGLRAKVARLSHACLVKEMHPSPAPHAPARARICAYGHDPAPAHLTVTDAGIVTRAILGNTMIHFVRAECVFEGCRAASCKIISRITIKAPLTSGNVTRPGDSDRVAAQVSGGHRGRPRQENVLPGPEGSRERAVSAMS